MPSAIGVAQASGRRPSPSCSVTAILLRHNKIRDCQIRHQVDATGLAVRWAGGRAGGWAGGSERADRRAGACGERGRGGEEEAAAAAAGWIPPAPFAPAPFATPPRPAAQPALPTESCPALSLPPLSSTACRNPSLRHQRITCEISENVMRARCEAHRLGLCMPSTEPARETPPEVLRGLRVAAAFFSASSFSASERRRSPNPDSPPPDQFPPSATSAPQDTLRLTSAMVCDDVTHSIQ